MARIRYDRYLKDVDELIVISNIDSERAVDVTPESFENPAIKFRLLETTGGEDLLAAFDVSDSSTSVAAYKELQDCAPQLINGQLHVVIDEYYGKRKIRRLEFTEGETAAPEQLQLCHITEY